MALQVDKSLAAIYTSAGDTSPKSKESLVLVLVSGCDTPRNSLVAEPEHWVAKNLPKASALSARHRWCEHCHHLSGIG